MSRGIFLIGADDRLVELHEAPYDSEDLLQRLLASYPSLLASDQVDATNPRRWLLVSREAPVPGELGGSGRWSLDHLFLDQDAIPTLVEVKRSSDTRIRREVVGQMLDYAANAVVYWPVEHLIDAFRAECARRTADPDQALADFLGPESDPGAFWQQVKTNLQAGRIRMLFVADVIPPELRRIVEFLNAQMDPAEVLAVEIRQFTGEGLRTLVPTVIGQTAVASDRKQPAGAARRQWDEPTFFAELAGRRPTAEVTVARELLAWGRPRMSRIWWGKGQQAGSFIPVLEHLGRDHQLFAVWTYGTVEIYFYWYTYREPFNSESKRLELLQRLNSIPGVTIPESGITRRPNIPMATLAQGDNLARFIEVFEWFIDQIRNTAPSSDASPSGSVPDLSLTDR
jgi:hypothetical protein